MGHAQRTYEEEAPLQKLTFLKGGLRGKSALGQKMGIDYYPFGETMPGRSLTSSFEKRNGYQGLFAEEDEETGYDQFEARLWDGRVGRWMTVDPAGQYHSPYNGMGNNPISGVDPDGRRVVFHNTGSNLTIFTRILQEWMLIADISIGVGDNGLLTLDAASLGVDGYSGSEIAKQQLISAIMNPDITYDIHLGSTHEKGSHWHNKPTTSMELVTSQLLGFQPTSASLEPMSIGPGMVALHELTHAMLQDYDIRGLPHDLNPGPVVNNMNKIRGQMSNSGLWDKSWGTRMHYDPVGISVDGVVDGYIGMDLPSLMHLDNVAAGRAVLNLKKFNFFRYRPLQRIQL